MCRLETAWRSGPESLYPLERVYPLERACRWGQVYPYRLGWACLLAAQRSVYLLAKAYRLGAEYSSVLA